MWIYASRKKEDGQWNAQTRPAQRRLRQYTALPAMKRQTWGGEASLSAPKRRRGENSTDLSGYECEFVEATEIDGEIWKDVPQSLAPGNKARVSNLGRVKSYSGVITAPTPDASGYVRVMIVGKKFRVHLLVLAAFEVPRPSPLHNQCNHIDRDTTNNRLENLEWATPPGNAQHSYATNGDRKSSGPLLAKPVRGKRDGEDWVEYESAYDAARKLGLSHRCVSLSCEKGGKVNKQYQFEFSEPNEVPLLEGEEWKDYGSGKISNLGRYQDYHGVVKTPTPEASGYAYVMIDRESHLVHRLVAKLFLPPPGPGQTQVNHIDGMGNQHWNLEWVTPSQNITHSHADPNRKSSGPKRSKKVRVRKIGTGTETNEWRVFDTAGLAAEALGVSRRTLDRRCGQKV